MVSEAVLFVGIDISSGRKPITFAALDDALEVVLLNQWGISDVVSCLEEYENVQLTVNFPASKSANEIYQDFQDKIKEIDFRPYSTKNGTRLWFESGTDDCFRVFQPRLLPRRTLEGRIQRALILYDEGLQIMDTMDFFEEITRYKLMQGEFPVENTYTTKQLDALVMAYVSWLAGNPAEKVVIRGDRILPVPR